MVNAYDVPADDLINAAKEELKKNEKIAAPEWALFAKTGAHKERPPQQDDFWQIRAASLLRKVYTKGPIGVSRLTTEYGGKKNRGSKPGKFRAGSGSIARVLLQQLGEAGYVKNTKQGRVITPQGQKFLDNTAYAVFKNPPERKALAPKEMHRGKRSIMPGEESRAGSKDSKKKWGSSRDEKDPSLGKGQTGPTLAKPQLGAARKDNKSPKAEAPKGKPEAGKTAAAEKPKDKK